MQYKIEKSKNGLDVLIINDKYIHSKFAPEKEGSDFKHDGKNLIAVFGIGLGYHITNIVNNNPDSLIVIYDPMKEIYDLYFNNYPDEKIHNNKSIFFFKELDDGKIYDIINEADVLFEGRIYFYSNTGYKNLFPEQEKIFFETIKKNMELITQNIMTESSFIHMWSKNFIYNSKNFSMMPLINWKKRQLDGNLAVIVCAGPGLDKELPSIKKNREKLTIFAVDTAIKPLYKNNITPDFVISLDGQFHSFDDFIIDDNCETCYIFDVVSYPKATKLVSNIIFCHTDNIFKNSIIEHFYHYNNLKIDGILTGGTVADYTLDICSKLGFNNIYFSGLDLSFPDLVTHCKNSPFYEKIINGSNYYNTSETFIIKAIANRKIKESESKIKNEKIITDFVLENYSYYINKYQEIFSELKIFNSIQKGIKISNLTDISLDVLVDNITTKRIKHKELMDANEKYLIESEKMIDFYKTTLDSFYNMSVVLKELLEKSFADINIWESVFNKIFDVFPLLKRIIRFTQFCLSKKNITKNDIAYYREIGFVILQSIYFFIRTLQKVLKL